VSIPFTQFLRPDGRRRFVEIELEDFVEHAAHEIIEKGGRFTVEELVDGTVSLACEFKVPSEDDEERDITIEVCPNGPAVPEAAKKMILRAREFLIKERVLK